MCFSISKSPAAGSEQPAATMCLLQPNCVSSNRHNAAIPSNTQHPDLCDVCLPWCCVLGIVCCVLRSGRAPFWQQERHWCSSWRQGQGVAAGQHSRRQRALGTQSVPAESPTVALAVML